VTKTKRETVNYIENHSGSIIYNSVSDNPQTVQLSILWILNLLVW